MLLSPCPTPSASATKCDTRAIAPTVASPSSGRSFGGNKVCERWARERLVWMEDLGIGYLPVTAAPYDQSYFDHYAGYACTGMGARLNAARLALVARHYRGALLDVGIGCGQFIESRRDTFGYDVNPAGVDWLNARDLFVDAYSTKVPAACFWDSVEHIADPAPLLANVTQFAFVALPVFRDLAHVLRSKHYKPDEHCWYFTQFGFVRFMAAHGFACVEANDEESVIGREDILSFAFRREVPAE